MVSIVEVGLEHDSVVVERMVLGSDLGGMVEEDLMQLV